KIEIEKVRKKVTEGIEAFDDTFEKLKTSPNINQKEKYEQDLKKEIKKLQRHRDQIKTWIASTDIKDKRELLENRKMIEKRMEAFKACEKEMKTKAYSKEGLSQVTKIDPKEKAKQETSSWITSVVDQLNTQIDMLEAEAEGLQGGPRKSKKDNGKLARIRELDQMVERHKWHIQRLELILRSMENGNITPEQVAEIKDDVDFYVEANQEDNFEEDEGLYDVLNLDVEEEMFGLNEEYYGGGVTGITQESDEEETSKAKESPVPEKAAPSTKETTSKATPPPAPEPSTAINTTGTTGRSTIKLVNTSKQSNVGNFPAKQGSASGVTSPIKTTPTSPHTTTSVPGGIGATGSIALALDTGSGPTAPVASTATPALSGYKPETNAWANGNVVAKLAKAATPTVAHPYSSMVTSTLPSTGPSSMTTSQPSTPVTINTPSPFLDHAIKSPASSTTSYSHSRAPSASHSVPDRRTSTVSQPAHLTGETSSKPSGGMPKGGVSDTSPLAYLRRQNLAGPFAELLTRMEGEYSSRWSQDDQLRSQLVDTSFQCLPDLAESEKPRQYTPEHPAQTPPYYPQVPLPIFDSSAIASKFSLDTLFFIFYYQQDTYQQYLAVKELQRLSWRFHKRYLAWFQRYDKPQVTNDDYEVGTYVFFDYEEGWRPRQKSDFKFEYQYLEDTELL
ncbi:General negative regulator of transcription subunit 5, partial [Dispira simplex]